MDLDDFMKTVAPARPQSRLLPHRDAIQKLRSAGYTLEQICSFLEQNGVSVTLSTLSKFLKPHSAGETPQAAPHVLQQAASDALVTTRPAPVGAATATRTREELAQEHPGLSRRQVDEKYVDQFAQRAENPLLKRHRKPSQG